MKYQELNEILCKAAKEKRVVEAFVTFTPDSFEESRTAVSSNTSFCRSMSAR